MRGSEVSSPISGMASDALGQFIQDKANGLGIRMKDLRPYILEIWRRLEEGETICGCKTKKKFCEVIFRRTPRSVQLMLAEEKDPPEAAWADKPKSLNDEERFERLYHFAEKHYEGDYERLEQDFESVLAAQRKQADIQEKYNG